MTEPARRKPNLLETVVETVLFEGRWLMAPFYLGLLLCLPLLLWVFGADIVHELPRVIAPGAKPEEAILLVLSLIDLSLAGNLVLIVIFSGYENFVSRMDAAAEEDRPEWMGTIDFSSLKMKLIASIVAISAISLLKTFMRLSEEPVPTAIIVWQLAILGSFLAAGISLALMDWLHGLGGHQKE
jgi:uncharacterized protein (TIGR00645 family)